jgi:hypothetical protein
MRLLSRPLSFILAVPLFSLLGGIGGLLTGALCRQEKWPRESVYGFAVLPLALGGFEQNRRRPSQISRRPAAILLVLGLAAPSGVRGA